MLEIVSNADWSKNIEILLRATAPVLTLEDEDKNVNSPSALHFAMRRGKLGVYILQNPPEVF